MKARQILPYPAERPKTAPELLLVGTIHRLPTLAPLLEELLRETRPALVTVEISPYSVQMRKKKWPGWERRLEALAGRIEQEVLLSLRQALEMPYEFRVPKKLGLFPVVPVDLNPYARRYLRELEALLENPPSPEETRLFAPEKELSYLRLFLAGLYQPPHTPEDERRERFWARKIRRLLKVKRPLVHIGGWRHLPGLLRLLPEATALVLQPESLLRPKRIGP